MKTLCTILFLAVISFSSLSQEPESSFFTVTSTWNDVSAGLDGWQAYNTPSINYNENGGNPGGYISAEAFTGSGFENTSAEFTGNYIQKPVNYISLDVLFPQNLPAAYDGNKAQIVISGSEGSWFFVLDRIVGSNSGVWQNADVYFNPNWSDEEAISNGWYSRFASTNPHFRSYRETMEQVASIAFKRIYAPYQIHIFGIDNFTISNRPAPSSPTPEEIAAQNAQFAFALATWDDPGLAENNWLPGHQVRTLEYRQNGGNPDGFLVAYGHPVVGILNTEGSFTGNYIQKGVNQISLDLILPDNLAVAVNNKASVKIISDTDTIGSWFYVLNDFNPAVTGSWQHFDFSFNSSWSDNEAKANGWNSGYSESNPRFKSFKNVMQEVTSIGVERFYDNSLHRLGVDNFKISKTTEQSPPVVNKNIKPANLKMNRPVRAITKPPTRVKKAVPVKTKKSTKSETTKKSGTKTRKK